MGFQARRVWRARKGDGGLFVIARQLACSDVKLAWRKSAAIRYPAVNGFEKDMINVNFIVRSDSRLRKPDPQRPQWRDTQVTCAKRLGVITPRASSEVSSFARRRIKGAEPTFIASKFVEFA